MPHQFNLTQVENRYDPIPSATPYPLFSYGKPEGAKITVESSPYEALSPMHYHDMSVYDRATREYIKNHQNEPQISVESGVLEPETKLYTGTNTAVENPALRWAEENSQSYKGYYGK